MAEPGLLPVDEATAEAVAAGLKLDGFFPEFSAELCSKVFPRSGVLHYRAGEALIREGDKGRDLFIILAGDVSIRRGQPAVEAGRLSHGGLIGEIALLTDGVRSASAVAATPVFAFRLAVEDVGYLLQHNPALAAHLDALARGRRG